MINRCRRLAANHYYCFFCFFRASVSGFLMCFIPAIRRLNGSASDFVISYSFIEYLEGIEISFFIILQASLFYCFGSGNISADGSDFILAACTLSQTH